MDNTITIKQFFENRIPEIANDWDNIKHLFHFKAIPPKTILLHEGDVAENVYIIKSEILRLWNNNDGKDITLQFFFENQFVASFESFYTDEPSSFTIESIEECELYVIQKNELLNLKDSYPQISEYMLQMISIRFIEYTKYFLSRIKDTPEQRYLDLKENYSEIIQRVPDYHIATYLGITPVSLCRIKQRLKNTVN